MISSGQFLSQKQSLQQRLSPQQIQYIKLLQLPTLALEQRVKEELEINPVLEEVDRGNEDPYAERDDDTREKDETDPVDSNDDIDWDELLHGDERDSYKTSSGGSDEDWRDLPKPYRETQLEGLEKQVALLPLNDREVLIADQILGSIDPDGYFRREISSIVDGIAFNQAVLVTEDEVEAVLKRIQRLDPAGIAARNLRECLLVQLEVLEGAHPAVETATKMLRDEWVSFEKKHFDKIKNRLHIDDEQLKQAYELVQGLDPKPGHGDDSLPSDNAYVTPDFEVKFQPAMDGDSDTSGEDGDVEDGEFIITLSSRNVPPLRISPQYKRMWDDLKQQGRKKNTEMRETQAFIKGKIESARWFIESIVQRQHTLLNVMRTIVALQEEFFKYGKGLRPMILKDIADRIHMDISTVSRVVNGKYVQTPFGVFELKYFFNEGLETEDGEEVSNRVVKNYLQEIIDAEDKRKPLSDQELVEALKQKGYKIARRTISKYREQLNIPVARLRKQII